MHLTIPVPPGHPAAGPVTVVITPPGPEVFTVIVLDAHKLLPHVPSALTKYVFVVPGVTTMEGPVPMLDPLPQPPAYQTQTAPEPSWPPWTVSVVLLLLQTSLKGALLVTDAGVVDTVSIDRFVVIALSQPAAFRICETWVPAAVMIVPPGGV